MRKPAAHGRDHQPDGPDSLYTGPWYYVGAGGTMPDGTPVPDFENGWTNVGGTSVPLRFRIVLGPPNQVRGGGTPDATVELSCEQKQIEIQGDVTGGSNGSTVFTLPPSHRPDYDTPIPGHDNAGVYVACRVYADGRFVRGQA